MRFDPLTDLLNAAEHIKRNEPKMQPGLVPWNEYQARKKPGRRIILELARDRRVMNWRERKRGKRRSYLAMRNGR